jgi:hypothetical protein
VAEGNRALRHPVAFGGSTVEVEGDQIASIGWRVHGNDAPALNGSPPLN